MISKTTAKGEFACLKFELRASEKNCIVSRPNLECAYDRILDENGKLYRVQIKYADSEPSASSEAVCVRLRRSDRCSKKAYTSNDVDFIAVYIPKTDQVCLLPPAIWDGKTSLVLRLKPAKNGQTKNVILASEFKW